MKHRIEPVGDWKAQVVRVQFDERRLEKIALAERLGELVGLKLEATTQTSHEKGDDLVVGRENELHDYDEADENGLFALESKRRVEDLSIH